MSKPPTPQAISALLKRAGFNRSESYPSRVRGMRNSSAGYWARGFLGEVRVRHACGTFMGNEAREREMLARYAEVIRAAGWNVTDPAGEGWAELIVTAQEESR